MPNEYLKDSTIKLVTLNNLEGLKKLPKDELFAKDKNGWNIAHWSTMIDCSDVLKFVYEISKNDEDFKKILLAKNGRGNTIAFLAATFGRLEVLKWLAKIAKTDEDFKQLFQHKNTRGDSIFNQAYTYSSDIRNFIEENLKKLCPSEKPCISETIRVYTRNLIRRLKIHTKDN